MRDFHEWPQHWQAFATGEVRLLRLLAGLVCRQRVLEQTSGRCGPLGDAEHVYERAQCCRHLSVAGIVEEEPLKGGGPILKHAKQLPRGKACDSLTARVSISNSHVLRRRGSQTPGYPKTVRRPSSARRLRSFDLGSAEHMDEKLSRVSPKRLNRFAGNVQARRPAEAVR